MKSTTGFEIPSNVMQAKPNISRSKSLYSELFRTYDIVLTCTEASKLFTLANGFFLLLMAKISIRTLMLITLGIAMLITIFTRGAPSADIFHAVLVLAFAIPGASWGYDRNRTSRSAVIGLCVWAIIGSLVLSAYVLLGGFG